MMGQMIGHGLPCVKSAELAHIELQDRMAPTHDVAALPPLMGVAPPPTRGSLARMSAMRKLLAYLRPYRHWVLLAQRGLYYKLTVAQFKGQEVPEGVG